MQSTVGIIGAGEMGQALGGVLERHQRARVVYYDREVRLAGQVSLAELAQVSDVIILCIPSTANRSVALALADLLTTKRVVLSVSKGLERESAMTMDQVLQSVLPSAVQVGLFFGPMLAEEIAAGLPTAGVIALEDSRSYEIVAPLWLDTNVVVTWQGDVRGVAIAGVLKNVYAIGMGALDATDLGHNVRGWYITRAVQEMQVITTQLGGQAVTALGLAGVGDLLTTGSTACSRNYTVGQELARFGKPQSQSEGLISLPTLRQLLGERWHDYPLLSGLATLLEGEGRIEDLFYETAKTS